MTPQSGDTISRNTLAAFAAQMTTAAFTAGLTIYLTRALGPAGFGVFALALSVTGLVQRPAGAGTTQAAARYMAERHGDSTGVAGVFGLALRIRLVTATLVGIGLFALAGPIADLYDAPDLAGPLRGVALAFVGQSLFDFFRTAFVALRRASVGFVSVLSESSMETAATVALVVAGGGATGASLGRAAGYAFGAVIGLVMLTRVLGRSPLLRPPPSPVPRREFAGYAGAMLVVATVTSLFQRLATLLLGALLNVTAVGIYSAPLRLMAFLAYPGLAVAQGVAPRQARHPDQPTKVVALGRALGYVLILHAVMVAFLAVWAGPLVELVLGSEFAESAEVLRALAPFIYLNGVAPILFSSLGYAGMGSRRIPIVVTALLVAAGLYLVLIPAWGVVGAAVATDVGYAVTVVGHLWLVQRFIGLPLRRLGMTVLRSLLAAGATVLALLAIGNNDLSVLQWAAGLLVGTAAFVAVLLLTRELTPSEIRSLFRVPTRALRGGV